MSNTALKLLLLEDNPADADFLQELLSEADGQTWTIVHVEYLHAALSQIQQQPFDLVLSDLSLPDAQGLDTVAQIHAFAPDLPIVVLTGLADEAIGLAALRQGAQDYLIKGQIEHDVLIRAVRYAIERAQTQRVMRQQSAAMAACVEGIAILNHNQEYTYLNQAHAQIYGYDDPAHLIGKTWKVLYDAAEVDRLQEVIMASSHRSHWRGETIGKRRNGERFHQELSLTPLQEGGLICTVRDISHRKQSEAELQKAHQELEQHADELATAYERLLNTLEELQTAQEELNEKNSELEQARQSEQLQRQRYQDLFSFAPDGYVITDVAGVIQEANQAIADMLGRKRDRLISTRLSAYIPAADLPLFQAKLEQLKAAPQAQTYELALQLRNRSPFAAAVRVTAIYSLNQELIGFRWLIRDITEQKRAEDTLRQSEARFRQIFQNAPIGMAVSEIQSRRLIQVNPAWCDLTGYTSAEAAHLTLDDISHPDDLLQDLQQLEQATSDGSDTYYMEKRYITKDSQVKWANLAVTVLRDPTEQPCFSLGMIEDISERKLAEEETRKALEKERELSELKSQFIAIASHEFRTPLTAILMASEFLDKYNQRLTEEKKRRHFDTIRSSIKRITQLLDDVLVLSQSEAGKLAFNPASLDLTQFCQRLVEEFQFSAGEKHTIVHTYQEDTSYVPLDENLLRHILTNLLSNALKYSPAGGTVWFDHTLDQEAVTFRIRDEGIGIPEADRPKLFSSFYRCSNTAKLPGTGLGLTIVKEAVELHGGHISFSSEVGQGTTFVVVIPVRREE